MDLLQLPLEARVPARDGRAARPERCVDAARAPAAGWRVVPLPSMPRPFARCGAGPAT